MRDQLNDIIMTTKWKIHSNKQLGETTCFYQILHNIKYMLTIQKCIANKNQNIHKYEQKWGDIENHLTWSTKQCANTPASSHTMLPNLIISYFVYIKLSVCKTSSCLSISIHKIPEKQVNDTSLNKLCAQISHIT